jgi:hypothetical protein
MVHDEHGLAENYIPPDVNSVYRQDRTALSYPASIFD